MRFLSNLSTVILAIILLLSVNTQVLADNDRDLVLPQKQVVEDNVSRSGNVFLEGSPLVQPFGTYFTSRDPINFYSTVNNYRMYDGNYGPTGGNLGAHSGFTQNGVADNQGMVQVSNRTNNDVDLTIRTEYFDLGANHTNATNFDTPNDLDNLILKSGQNYGLRFNTSGGYPLVLEIVLEMGSWMNVQIFTPSNQVFAQNSWFATRKVEHIPMVSMENGTHTLILTPNIATVLLRLRILNEFDLEQIDTVTSGTFQSTDTATRFFEMEADDISVINFNSQVYADFGNSGGIFIFDMRMTGVLGMAGNYLGQVHGFVIIALVAEVPYVSEFLEPQNKHLDVPEGVKLSYSFTVEVYDIPMLPMDVDFITSPHDYPGSNNFYYFDAGEMSILSINASSSVDATLFGEKGVRTIRSSSNNLYDNGEDGDALVPVSGMYIISIPRGNELRITLFVPQIFSGSVDLGFNDRVFFYVNDTSFNFNSFNFTLTNHPNASIDMQFDYYDSTGDPTDSDSFTLKDISSNTTKYWQSDNHTSEYTPWDSIGLSFMRLIHLGNRVYNSTLSNPTIVDSDSIDLRAKLDITIQDRLTTLSKANPSDIYEKHNLNDGSSVNVDVYHQNNTVALWNTMNLVRGAYLLTITVLNKPLTNFQLISEMYSTFGALSNYNFALNETISFEFAVAQTMVLGLYLQFGAVFGNLNGSISISLSTLPVFTLTAITLGYLNLFHTLSVVQNEFQRYSPAVAVAILAIPVAVIGYRRFRTGGLRQ